MKKILFYIQLLLLYSCSLSSSNERTETGYTKKLETFDCIYVDSIELKELKPMSNIFESMLDNTISLINQDKLLCATLPINCFEMYVLTKDFHDTICSIVPYNTDNISFYQSDYDGYCGFYYWNSMIVFVKGNVVDSYFEAKDNSRRFYSGISSCDGINEWASFKITGDSFSISKRAE